MRPQEKIKPLERGKAGIEDMMNKINELVDAHNGDRKPPTTADKAKETKTD